MLFFVEAHKWGGAPSCGSVLDRLGHTVLYEVKPEDSNAQDRGEAALSKAGATRDDAAGEAYDKSRSFGAWVSGRTDSRSARCGREQRPAPVNSGRQK